MELMEEIDELRAIVDEGTERKSPALMSEGAADIDNALSIKASLAQNAPNPFTERTTICYRRECVYSNGRISCSHCRWQ